MDLDKLSLGDKVLAASGVVFLISLFLPWWGLEVDTGFGTVEGHNNGTDYFLTGWLPLLIIIAMIVCVYLQKFTDTQLPDTPLPWSQIYLIAGAVVGVLLILRLAITSSEHSVDLDRKYGLFIAVLAALGVAAAGYLKFQEGDDGASAGAGSAPPTPF